MGLSKCHVSGLFASLNIIHCLSVLISLKLIIKSNKVIIKSLIVARAKRGLTIRKQPSFVPGPRIFYCYALLFSAGQ